MSRNTMLRCRGLPMGARSSRPVTEAANSPILAGRRSGCPRGGNKTTTFPFENGTREIVPAGTFPEKAAMILQRTRPPLLETPWSVLGSNVFTPNESFFVRWHLPDFPTDIDIDTYRVSVFGHV